MGKPVNGQSQELILKRRKELLGRAQHKIRVITAAFDLEANEEAREVVEEFEQMKKDIIAGKHDKGAK